MIAAPAAVAERLDGFVVSTLGAAGDPGVALVVVNSHGVVSCRGFGRDVDGNRVTCDTPFALASLTKSVTAIAAVQLAENRSIELDAPITRYLPWFAVSGQAAAGITVRDLLNQRSGFDTASGLAYLAVPASAKMTLEARVRALAGARVGRPGERFEYSNANYDLLGAIVEARSGIPYQSYVRKRVFASLGITRVAFACDEPVRGFVRIFSIPVPAPRFPRLCADVPAGGLVMSASQYGRYLAAHLDAGKTWSRAILSAAGWETLHRSPPDEPYAMGWYESFNTDGLRELRHNGWAPDFHGFAVLYPSLDIGAARLANANEVPDAGRSTPIEIGMERILRGANPPQPPVIPPDLYLRLAVLAALIFATFSMLRRTRTIAGSAFASVVKIGAIVAILVYVLPQWGYSPYVGFIFSPDLSTMLFVLIVLLAIGAVRALIWILNPTPQPAARA
ncbi:MAG: beta-lactamase family protein, partial [Candidatus Eremiobacteraeota bacterium]|nr:beta-lactamase family protein [Candidatus Eremiobacteraeota bacterium]